MIQKIKNIGESLAELARQGGEIVVYHSTDDPVVPLSHGKGFIEALPGSTLQTFVDRGHFNQETFPELEDKLREISRRT